MLSEVIDAQKRNIAKLNVSEAELEKVQTQTKFRYAKTLLQIGSKKEAVRLAKESWSGAESFFEKAKFIIRLFVPMSVVRFRKSLRKKKLIAASSTR